MSTLALSGWGQPADALAHVCPDGTTHFRYSEHPSVEACFAALSAHKNAEVVVGWSLGGQVAVRAVAAGILKPKRLVLLAAPFQCKADDAFPLGAPAFMLAQSRAMFMENARAMLQQFQMFLAMGDSKQQSVLHALLQHPATLEGRHWLFWFDELVRFSCLSLDLSHFPQTDLIYGENDAIIRIPQGEAYARHLPNAKLHRLAGCGHAPQWHDASFAQRVINGE